jgi:PIN domain nuclease of toxin-antitoxin system
MIFLDTHVILWRALDPGKIPLKTRHALEQEEESRPLRICEISLFEIAMLLHRGRLNTELVNKDPADRIILAAAAHNKARLATADENLRKAGIVPTLW